MCDATFADGSPQSLYFASGPQAGLFKGMTVLLTEWGLDKEAKLNTQCRKFQCPIGNKNCCQRQVLYNRLDFVQAKSLLVTRCYSCQSSIANLILLNSVGDLQSAFTANFPHPLKKPIWRAMCCWHSSQFHWGACASG